MSEQPHLETSTEVEDKDATATAATTEDASASEAGEPETVVSTDSNDGAEAAAAEAPADVSDHSAAATEASPEADAPAEEAKAEEADAPAEEAKAEEADAPAEEAKAEEADAPAEEAKAEEADAPAEEAKAEEADAPAEEAKAEEADAPAEEAKAEEADAPAEEAKAEEADAPSEEAKAEDAESMRELLAAKEAKLSIAGKVIGWNKGGYHVAIGKIAAFCPVSQIEIGNPRSPKKYLDKDFDFRIIEIQEGGRRVVVSRAAALKAKRAVDAAKVRETLKAGAVLDGRVSSLTDFGAFVNLGGGVEGLVHVSEISRQRVEHAKEVLNVGKKVKVQVLKVEKGGKRISLSMKRLEADPWDGVQDRFQPGGEFKGTISRATEFGLFVEVEPGLEGLVHTSRLPLGASISEDESLRVGAEITGWVHEVERKRRRLSLSLRPVAEGNPWKDVAERFPEGDVVEGKVERLAKFGVFVELEPGLTGLLPFAVLGGGIANPKRQFQVGKGVKVKVLSVDTGRKRISLGTETSKAEGSDQDYKNYMKTQRKVEAESGLGTLAQAFAKMKERSAQ